MTITMFLFHLLFLLSSQPGQSGPQSQDTVSLTGFLVELDCATVTAHHVIHDSRCLEDHKKDLRFGLLLYDYTWYTFDNDSNKKAAALLPALSHDLHVTATGRLTSLKTRNSRFAVSSLVIQPPPESPPH